MTATSQPLTPTVSDPAELGFDPQRLARIDRHIKEKYLDTGLYPGFSLAICREDEVAYVSHQGYADDAIFRIYSMTKPITSIALLQLFEQAKIALTDPVSTYLPGWENLRVFADGSPLNYTTTFPEREMQVRDLLTHTSGLTYSWMGRHPVDAIYRARHVSSPADTTEEFVNKLATIPLLFSPGTRWSYSVATDVVGRLVEVVSGQPLDEYFAEHIFAPLGMADTAFWVNDDRAARLVSNHAHPELSPFGVPEGATGPMAVIDDGGANSPYRSRPTFLSGGGGLVSTLADYTRFTQALLAGGAWGEHRILGSKTLDYATANHLPQNRDLAEMGQAVFSEANFEGTGFGLGFSVIVDPVAGGVTASEGEFAWGGAASTTFFVDPLEGISVVGMTQLMPSSAYPIRPELKMLIYGAMTS